MVKKRNPAADVIRCFALFCVVSVHFFLNSGFYDDPVCGTRMFIMTLMRNFFMICVPLFLMLSGYLLRNKQLTKEYYKRIFKIIGVYVISGLACILFSIVFVDDEYNLGQVILSILNYTASPYAWYIEMYLGLFLLIPFLNIMYNNVPTKNWKQVLLLTFVVLTALPSIVNIYSFKSLFPGTSDAFKKLMPQWWVSIYPITYYFIGCYLGEYGLKIRKIWCALIVILSTLVVGMYSYYYSYGDIFEYSPWNEHEAFFTLLIAVFTFVFIMNLNYDKMNVRFAGFLRKVSGLCLGGYLVSWIFDRILYALLERSVPVIPERLKYYFIIVPTVYVLSLLLSYFVDKIQWILEKVFCLIIVIFKKVKLINPSKD